MKMLLVQILFLFVFNRLNMVLIIFRHFTAQRKVTVAVIGTITAETTKAPDIIAAVVAVTMIKNARERIAVMIIGAPKNPGEKMKTFHF